MPTPQQAAALKLVVSAVVDAVTVAGERGAPAGVLYAGMMAHGASLEQFESLMSALVRLGKLTKSGDLYFVAAA